MGQREYASNPADLGEGTLAELFLDAVDRLGRHAAFRHHRDGSWHRLTYEEVFDRVWAVAGGLSRAGLSRGDRAAILSDNRPEWALADYACLLSGVVDVPIYSTLIPSQIRYILNDAGVRLIFVADREQMEKVLEIRDDLPELRQIVVFDPPAGDLPEGVRAWRDFLAEGADALAGGSEAGFRADALSAAPGTRPPSSTPPGPRATPRGSCSPTTTSPPTSGRRARSFPWTTRTRASPSSPSPTSSSGWWTTSSSTRGAPSSTPAPWRRCPRT
jgi:long-chain acyl-CoA synthetase